MMQKAFHSPQGGDATDADKPKSGSNARIARSGSVPQILGDERTTREDRPAVPPARLPSCKIYLSHRDFTAPHASNVAGAGLPRGVAAAKHFAIACSRAAVSSVALSQADPATATHWFWKTPTTANRDFALSPLALRHASSAPSRAARSVGLPATMADETSALSGVAPIAIATQASERVGRPATNTAAHKTLSRFLLIMSSTVRLWRAPKAIPFATKSGPSPGLKIILFGHAAYVVPRPRCSRYANVSAIWRHRAAMSRNHHLLCGSRPQLAIVRPLQALQRIQR
jgi:hypothetical protein